MAIYLLQNIHPTALSSSQINAAIAEGASPTEAIANANAVVPPLLKGEAGFTRARATEISSDALDSISPVKAILIQGDALHGGVKNRGD